MIQTCLVHRLGVIEYEAAWHMQEELADQIAKGQRPPTLLLLEHPHTYTFGRRGRSENLLWDETELARCGVKVLWVDRGGDVTYHGPGQLVGYPLIPLGNDGLFSDKLGSNAGSARLPQADYVGYVRRLEQTLILALSRLGVDAFRLEGLTGVWVDRPTTSPPAKDAQPAKVARPAKVAAIGVKVDVHGVTRHGFALNIHPDMAYWGGIVACGLADYPVTSLAELMATPPDMGTTIQTIIDAFAQVYQYHITEEVL